MTKEEIVRTLTEAHNYIYDIKVNGEDVYRMANALARIRGVVEQMQKERGDEDATSALHEDGLVE